MQGKINLKYRILDGQERTGIKIKPLELNFDHYFFLYLKRGQENTIFSLNKKHEKNK